MEDLSRELERELKAHVRPTPVVRKINRNLYYIDDVGRMKPAGWIKTMLRLTLFLMLIFCGASVFFYFLYQDQEGSYVNLTQRFNRAEMTIKKLKKDKEILMARLIISGNLPLNLSEELSQEDRKDGADGIIDADSHAAADSHTADTGKVYTDPSLNVAVATKDVNVGAEKGQSPESKIPAEPNSPKEEETVDVVKAGESMAWGVDVENLKVNRDKANGDILVRFDIRNKNDTSGNVSGYIFVILKPKSSTKEKWLLLPESFIKDNLPAQPKKGQYFSIARFKPVKLRAKKQQNSSVYTSASVFVFNENSDLILKKEILINGGER